MKKITGQQIKKLLAILFPYYGYEVWGANFASCFTTQNEQLSIDIDELPSVKELVDALNDCDIPLELVKICRYDHHLILQINNFDTESDFLFNI